MIDGEETLYNLSTDIQESKDLKEEYPDIFKELIRAYDKWESGLKEEMILS
jgi:hypothetical protein